MRLLLDEMWSPAIALELRKRDNIADYEPLVTEAETRATAHHGVVFCPSRQFDRSDPRTIGRMVDALAALLNSSETSTLPLSRRYWLRRAG